MAEIKRTNGRAVLDYMARDYDSLLYAMRERVREKLPEWTDASSEADMGNVLLEAFAHMGDILSYYQDRIAGESFLGTAQTRRSIIQHLRLIGYTLGTAAPAAATLSLLFPLDYQGTVTIKQGDAFATKSQRDRPSVRFEYAGDVSLEIDCTRLSSTTDPATGQRYRYYGLDPYSAQSAGSFRRVGIPVEEGRLVLAERLGVSDGTANQRFPLAHPRLILRPSDQNRLDNRDLTLLVEYGGQITRWHLRESLAFSGSDDRDFVVSIDEHDRASVSFGDGTFGAMPPDGAVIKASYRVGGGAHGNVGARTITTIASASQLSLIGASVINVAPATGGDDRESIEHAVLQAPAVFRARKRAVTRADYEALARNYQGVGRVRAVADSWATVTLYVAPAGGGPLTDSLRAGLLAYFEDKRPLTTRIEIAGVDYVPIYVTARIGVNAYYEHKEIAAHVQTAAGKLLAFERVDFAQTIYLSKFYEAIEAIDGVSYVTITGFSRDIPRAGNGDGLIKLGANELPCIPGDPNYTTGINVAIVGTEGGA
ncbi:baseplate J/gp47 family protein [Candidatus Chloroploca sp. M-50]|uniref:Baseplate J/gp47 family protein n=1 Tax=Candidatus Chloroploca mongolica TaxID=2528176 RepID=A0ABS4DF91_9CHLR|nr:baseplate J/gp47 family protein [Candidatus Chloroploca mongolica]MBP1468101.1 baseplate J/gp47 family protein [Candidatus Chloroploca mongolica]